MSLSERLTTIVNALPLRLLRQQTDSPMRRPTLRSSARAVTCLMAAAAIAPAAAQQVADTAFRPRIDKPAYQAGKGPVVLIDEAHENFHTATGRYQPFADLLQRDGYVVKPSTVPLSARALEAARVLVIANATKTLATEEAAAVRDWIREGGSLLLIADHPPFDAAAADLGKLLGVRFSGTVAWPEGGDSARIVFRRTNGGLVDHPVTAGIEAVATFTGTAFELDVPGQPLLVFGPAVYSSRMAEARRTHLKGWLQGALLQLGRGRIAVFGEAAMFSAQLSGPDRRPMGMNAPIAAQNAQFLLNVLRWLTSSGHRATANSGGRQPGTAMDPRAVTLAFNERVNNRDPDGLGELMTEDHTFVDSAGQAIRGKAKCLEAWRAFFRSFPDYRNVFESFAVEADTVVVVGHSTCSDSRLNGRALWIARAGGDKLAEWRVYEDTPVNRLALGLPVHEPDR